MLRYVKVALVLAVPACASAQGTDPAAPAPAHDHAAMHSMMHPAPQPTRIVVNATGTASRAPEQAVVSLAIETAGRSARDAADQNAQVMARIVAALRRLDIAEDKIRTTAYNMYPEYRHFEPTRDGAEVRQPEIIGYRVMNQVSVTVDGASRAGAVIDAALAAGANRVDGLYFQLRENEADAVRAEALREAMAKARAEAALLAEAADLQLGAPMEISTSYGYMPPPMPMPMYARDMAQMAPAAPTPVQPGTVEVQASVNIVYTAHP